MSRTPPPRRGRPPRNAERTAAARERILAVARRLFADGGYDQVTMRRIASLAECSPAALYTLFPAKRDLLRHLWEQVFADLATQLEAVDAAAPAGQAPLVRVAALCRAYLAFWRGRPDDFRAIFLIEDRLQGEDDRYFVERSQALPRLNRLALAIAAAQAAGALRPGPPAALQNVLLCGLQGLAMNLITIPEYGWGPPEALIEDTLGALLQGLR